MWKEWLEGVECEGKEELDRECNKNRRAWCTSACDPDHHVHLFLTFMVPSVFER